MLTEISAAAGTNIAGFLFMHSDSCFAVSVALMRARSFIVLPLSVLLCLLVDNFRGMQNGASLACIHQDTRGIPSVLHGEG